MYCAKNNINLSYNPPTADVKDDSKKGKLFRYTPDEAHYFLEQKTYPLNHQDMRQKFWLCSIA